MYRPESDSLHNPVMLNQVMEYLDPKDQKTYVDCTFGAGGYSKSILQKANCMVYAVDCDPEVKSIADELGNRYNNFKFENCKFSEIERFLLKYHVKKIDGLVLDLGVSSMQLDDRERGFSFMGDAHLDMRMSKEGIDASYVVNELSEEEIADIIYYFGDETYARRIARKICAQRVDSKITSTIELANIVRSVKPKLYSKIDPATKTFQAIRIYVNKELEELETILKISSDWLNIGGKLITVSFHSLEDSIVKKFINKENGRDSSISRYMPELANEKQIPKFRLLTKKTLSPSQEEIHLNPRSRSAKFRAIEKIGD